MFVLLLLCVRCLLWDFIGAMDGVSCVCDCDLRGLPGLMTSWVVNSFMICAPVGMFVYGLICCDRLVFLFLIALCSDFWMFVKFVYVVCCGFWWVHAVVTLTLYLIGFVLVFALFWVCDL